MAQRTGRPPGLALDGPKIRELRVGLGLTTTQVAEKVGLHPQSVRHAEKGRPVSDVFASRLARALSTPDEPVTVADLLAEEEDDQDDAETKIPA